jgi:hypothetical protein
MREIARPGRLGPLSGGRGSWASSSHDWPKRAEAPRDEAPTWRIQHKGSREMPGLLKPRLSFETGPAPGQC